MTAAFVIDRERLPKPWANPLVFYAANGEREVEVEVQEAAAIEYQANAFAKRSMPSSFEQAADVRETFAVLIEAALNDKIDDDCEPAPRIVLTPADLDPS